ncbi:MAG: L-2-amino-thiazoline-4-carboxylic acid hydrolase [Candidatus Heimdallarchaeaceae archaeon]|jgi:hypothetical protein
MDVKEINELNKELEHAKNEWSVLYSYLYYYLAKEFKKLGQEGEEALRKGIRNYGEARGNRLRKRHQKEGLPITMKTLFTNYDLPGDTKSKRKQIKLNENERESYTYICNLEKVWREIGGEEGDYLGSLYCDEFHQAMWGAYKEGTVVELPELLTKNDPHCHFIVYKK